MNKTIICLLIGLTLSASVCLGQDNSGTDMSQTAQTIQKKLENSVQELNLLRGRIVEEKLPMSRKVNELESKLSELRIEYQDVVRTLDTRKLDLINMENDLKSKHDQADYLSNLLNEYIRKFESHLHISESQRYQEVITKAKLAPENSNISELDKYITQSDLLFTSLDRLDEVFGGVVFNGKAVDDSGLMKEGKFLAVGPSVLFMSNDGSVLGTVQQRLGSLEPSIIAYGTETDIAAAKALINDNKGIFPLDPTGGNAHVVEETEQTLTEHIAKGGPVMYPILGMAGLALLVALIKWVHLVSLRKPSKKNFESLLHAIADNDNEKAQAIALAMPGPAGKMLARGAEHLAEPTELIEEVMFETVLSTRLNLQKLLPFISICASSAPLLGLLGTVTGIINTFKLITVFGSGDVKTLSGGISEALITTEFGLIVAIPSLMLHAFLSRKAKSIVDEMDQRAVSFVNQVSKSKAKSTEGLVSA